MKSFCNHKKKIKLVTKVSIVHVTHGLSPLANKTQATRLDRDLTNLTRATLALVDPTLKEKTLHVQGCGMQFNMQAWNLHINNGL